MQCHSSPRESSSQGRDQECRSQFQGIQFPVSPGRTPDPIPTLLHLHWSRPAPLLKSALESPPSSARSSRAPSSTLSSRASSCYQDWPREGLNSKIPAPEPVLVLEFVLMLTSVLKIKTGDCHSHQLNCTAFPASLWPLTCTPSLSLTPDLYQGILHTHYYQSCALYNRHSSRHSLSGLEVTSSSSVLSLTCWILEALWISSSS